MEIPGGDAGTGGASGGGGRSVGAEGVCSDGTGCNCGAVTAGGTGPGARSAAMAGRPRLRSGAVITVVATEERSMICLTCNVALKRGELAFACRCQVWASNKACTLKENKRAACSGPQENRRPIASPANGLQCFQLLNHAMNDRGCLGKVHIGVVARVNIGVGGDGWIVGIPGQHHGGREFTAASHGDSQ